MPQIDRVLVTGGLGFIGGHTTELLTKEGYAVVVLDNLEPQVHGDKPPACEAEFVKGDVRDRELLAELVKEVDAVIHLAAAVGVGQSMYQVEKYVDYNTRGTATLLDVLINEENKVKKLVVASSMSIYGEGKYLCESCGVVYPPLREEKQLIRQEWEPKCPSCGKTVESLPTDEEKPLMPTSIYAQTKRHQEEMCLLVGKTYGIPTVALRYFNVYGPGQSLRNPYTGVCAIFSTRILNNKPPYIFEDGLQTRDFVHVKDVATANLLALERSGGDYQAINIGSGKPISILELAQTLIQLYGSSLKPYVSGRYRKGDIRHCYADISRARSKLGYDPKISVKEGLADLVEWAKLHKWDAEDLFDKALQELEEKKLA